MSIVEQIIAGELDGDLIEILNAAKYRLEQTAKTRSRNLRAGTRIRIPEDSDTVVGGREGVVKRVNSKTVTIELDPVPYDHRNGWRVPHSWVVAV